MNATVRSLWLAVLVTCRPAYASAEPWAVSIKCPELSVEARAELEVRHLVALRAVPGEPATLVIRCTEATVEGAWQREGRTLSLRSVTRTPGDNLLEVAHWLASMLIGVVQANGVPTVAEKAEKAPETPEPASEPQRVTAVKAREPNAPAPNGALRHSFSVGVAASSHLFASELPGSIGPTLVGTFSLTERFGVHGAVGYEWSLGNVAGFSSEEGLAGLHLDTALLPWFSVLVGPALSVVRVKSEAHPGDTRTSITGGLELLARAQAPWSGISPFAELGLRSLLRPREIRRGDDVVLSIPSWQVVLMLGAQFGGSREK